MWGIGDTKNPAGALYTLVSYVPRYQVLWVTGSCGIFRYGMRLGAVSGTLGLLPMLRA